MTTGKINQVTCARKTLGFRSGRRRRRVSDRQAKPGAHERVLAWSIFRQHCYFQRKTASVSEKQRLCPSVGNYYSVLDCESIARRSENKVHLGTTHFSTWPHGRVLWKHLSVPDSRPRFKVGSKTRHSVIAKLWRIRPARGSIYPPALCVRRHSEGQKHGQISPPSENRP